MLDAEEDYMDAHGGTSFIGERIIAFAKSNNLSVIAAPPPPKYSKAKQKDAAFGEYNFSRLLLPPMKFDPKKQRHVRQKTLEEDQADKPWPQIEQELMWAVCGSGGLKMCRNVVDAKLDGPYLKQYEEIYSAQYRKEMILKKEQQLLRKMTKEQKRKYMKMKNQEIEKARIKATGNHGGTIEKVGDRYVIRNPGEPLTGKLPTPMATEARKKPTSAFGEQMAKAAAFGARRKVEVDRRKKDMIQKAKAVMGEGGDAEMIAKAKAAMLSGQVDTSSLMDEINELRDRLQNQKKGRKVDAKTEL